ncbi:hypothetical protein IGI04_026725 [Brassica rapa subsp. trilocularis]|uniref:Uncharacterized protein n=1 Tax=Brassica rapa subsp. trilocularis TaxID=1813537 RepID=A0ABQ7L0M5_BRACM|nr:hypothetical protein IGI04_026725 [Brassica rapa subsp. trilocularis]
MKVVRPEAATGPSTQNAPFHLFFSIVGFLWSGKCTSVIEARLLRFWEARNIKCGGELMWVDMLLVDVNATMMQATINASGLPRFQSRLAAGTMFSVSGFDVSANHLNQKLLALDVEPEVMPLPVITSSSWERAVPASSTSSIKYGGADKIETVTVSELNTYVLNSTPQIHCLYLS